MPFIRTMKEKKTWRILRAHDNEASPWGLDLNAIDKNHEGKKKKKHGVEKICGQYSIHEILNTHLL